LEKPPESGGFSLFRPMGYPQDEALENLAHIACHDGIALLNDRPRKALTGLPGA
jgi:hypothetical protein